MIPRVFHQIWIGGNLPAEFERYAETWRTLHPGWEHRLWGGPEELRLQNAHLYKTAEAYVPSHTVMQFRADILRYEILLNHGGVYVDADFECFKSIEPLLGRVKAFAAWEVQNVWVNQAILGAEKGHPFIERLIEGLPARAERLKGQRPNVISGPQYVTTCFDPSELTLFPQAFFYPYSFRELDAKGPWPKAYAAHHWHQKRKERDSPRKARPTRVPRRPYLSVYGGTTRRTSSTGATPSGDR